MLNVLIAGAGLAGLSAGLSLRRAGHNVHLFERSRMNNEVGAAINVPPNATRFLKAWGLDPARWRFVKSRCAQFRDPFTMEVTNTVWSAETAASIGGAELYYAHRVDLHNALKCMATRQDGPGRPVTIHLGSAVVGYDPSTPSITLANGRIISGDVVIGADGVHSIAPEAVLGRKNEPVAPEHSNFAFRFLIPAEVLEQDPETQFWNQDRDGRLDIFADNETRRRIIAYTCRGNTTHNFVGIFFDEDSEGETREDWKKQASVSDVLDRYSDFHPGLRKVISKATEVMRWPLLYRHPIPTWYKGRMALAGDAAHPMLPHQAQGGAQALEDGLVLGIVLHGAATSNEVERRLGMYDAIRRNRASVIQILSNVGQDQIHLVHGELGKYMATKDFPNSPLDILKHNYGYDAVRETLRVMKAHDSSFELPSDFFETEVTGVADGVAVKSIRSRL